MSANFAFDPFAPGPRMTELATYALTQTRRILSDAVVQDLLYAKYDDPMLGIWVPIWSCATTPKIYRRSRPLPTTCAELSGSTIPT